MFSSTPSIKILWTPRTPCHTHPCALHMHAHAPHSHSRTWHTGTAFDGLPLLLHIQREFQSFKRFIFSSSFTCLSLSPPSSLLSFAPLTSSLFASSFVVGVMVGIRRVGHEESRRCSSARTSCFTTAWKIWYDKSECVCVRERVRVEWERRRRREGRERRGERGKLTVPDVLRVLARSLSVICQKQTFAFAWSASYS